MKIMLDPGHGGRDPGATVPGADEKHVALAYALELRDRLQVGHEVRMTREDDTFVSLSARADAANDWGADCFISLHANAASSALANGAWVIYDDKSPPQNGPALATAIFQDLAKVEGVADADPAEEVYADRTGWVGGRDLTVVSRTRMTAVLVELGFMTNLEDLTDMLDPGVRSAICRAIHRGVQRWGFNRGLWTPDVPPIDLAGEIPPEVFDIEVRRLVEATAGEGESMGDYLRRLLGAAARHPAVREAVGSVLDQALEEVIDAITGRREGA